MRFTSSHFDIAVYSVDLNLFVCSNKKNQPGGGGNLRKLPVYVSYMSILGYELLRRHGEQPPNRLLAYRY